MTIPHLVGLRRRSLCVVALALCLCIIMLMLGVPGTLLSAADISDEFSVSALEGFSLPQTLPPLTLSSESISAVELPQSTHLFVLASQQFHPPAN
ncbi:MAG: hypothetical protein HP491_01505 [Nitrospira sp.]|nr:hypothetical protein [Nitrospira sp.]MBH0183164.1 hypothetical protein [Nitrospira sp.]MBH0184080.1 hypothetical protein [Nitrospira sp.]